MLRTIVKKGSYHDSVVLMLLTNQIASLEGVNKVSIMMATPANKEIFRQSGLDSEELQRHPPMIWSLLLMWMMRYPGESYGGSRQLF